MTNKNELENIIEFVHQSINDVLRIKDEVVEINHLSHKGNQLLELAESLTENENLNESRVLTKDKIAMYRQKIDSVDKLL